MSRPIDALTVEGPPFGPPPWCGWDGERVSLDGCSVEMPAEDDVAEVIAQGTTNAWDWDGDTAAVLRLVDGRFMGWESSWGPTGSGFSRDAYGGNAVVFFATSLDAVIWRGLGAEGRRLCGYPEVRP